MSNVNLETLNPTHSVGKYDAVFSLKEKFSDVMKEISHIVLTSKKSGELNNDDFYDNRVRKMKKDSLRTKDNRTKEQV